MPLAALRTVAKPQVRQRQPCSPLRSAPPPTYYPDAITCTQNGVGAFILQCKRLDFHYCDWAGSSRGLK